MTRDPDVLERLAPLSGAPSRGYEDLVRLRAKRQLARKIGAIAVVTVLVATLLGIGIVTIGDRRSRPADRSGDLGIFAPAAGRIVYQRSVGGHPVGLWAVDPAASDAFRFQKAVNSDEEAEPLGWSSDGTELLIERTAPGEDQGGPALLSILHADGSETRVTTDPMFITGATISPDGSRVVFIGIRNENAGLYAVDAEGGRPVLLNGDVGGIGGGWPIFSPDGTQIAYVEGVEGVDYRNRVWVMNADGTDAHQIVAADRTPTRIASGLAWSPAGDRIALGLWGARGNRSTSAIYTFAPDGSGLTRVINDGIMPYWSPDGSQIAYTIEGPSMDGSDRVLAVADADGSDARTFGFAISGPWHPALRGTRASR
jgi:dipeptidyl aminopeptidase/acylaminoacyl peptidase